jgi:shikimate kinase
MKDEAALQLLFEERRPFYATADLKVVTEGRTVAQVAEEVITKLGLTPGQAI